MLNGAHLAAEDDDLLANLPRAGQMGTHVHGKRFFRSEIGNQKINVIVDGARLALLGVGYTDLPVVDLKSVQ